MQFFKKNTPSPSSSKSKPEKSFPLHNFIYDLSIVSSFPQKNIILPIKRVKTPNIGIFGKRAKSNENNTKNNKNNNLFTTQQLLIRNYKKSDDNLKTIEPQKAIKMPTYINLEEGKPQKTTQFIKTLGFLPEINVISENTGNMQEKSEKVVNFTKTKPKTVNNQFIPYKDRNKVITVNINKNHQFSMKNRKNSPVFQNNLKKFEFKDEKAKLAKINENHEKYGSWSIKSSISCNLPEDV